VEDVGDAARHARREVATRRPKDDHTAAGHVFAAVIADRLDDGIDAAVTHAEAFARQAANVGIAGGRAIEGDGADDDVLFRYEGRAGGRIDDDLAARQALADVIVGIALKRERHAARHEGAEALSGRALEMQLDRVLGQPLGAVLTRDLAAGDGADDAVDI